MTYATKVFLTEYKAVKDTTSRGYVKIHLSHPDSPSKSFHIITPGATFKGGYASLAGALEPRNYGIEVIKL